MYNRVLLSIGSEEEKEKAEGPEFFLLEGEKNEEEGDEVAGFSQKEARPSSGEADKVNGNHHVNEKGMGRI